MLSGHSSRYSPSAILAASLFVLATVGGASDVVESEDLAGLNGAERIAALALRAEEMAGEDPRQSLLLGGEALELLQRFPAVKTELDVLISMTTAATSTGDVDVATSHSEKALTLAEKLGDANSRARALHSRAAVFFAQARYEEGSNLAKQAEEWARRQEDSKVLISALTLLANISFETGSPAAAIERYFEALRSAEDGGNPAQVAMLLNNIGSVYLSIEEFDESLKYYSRALDLSRELENRQLSAILLLNMASIHGEQGNHDEELDHYENALVIAQEINHKPIIATILINQSDVYLGLGENARAMDTARRALAMSRELNNPLMEAISEMNLGQGLLNAGRLLEGREQLQTTLVSVEKLGADLQIQEILEILTRNYEDNGDFEQALRHFRRYKEVTDRQTSAQSRERIAEVEAQYETARQEKEIAILTRDRELQDLALARQRVLRNSIFAVAVLLILLVVILVQRFRFKAEAHRRLGAITQELERQALTDSLTKLNNRRYLLGQIGQIVASVLRRHRDSETRSLDMTIFMIDIDRFKQINDRFGHEIGDKVLIAFADRLRSLIREGDILTRWGGEEFLLLSQDCDFEHGALVSDRIVASFDEAPLELEGAAPRVRCSIGYATFPFLDNDPERVSWEQLVRVADNALYLAKLAGRDTWTGVRALKESLDDIELELLLENLDQAAKSQIVELRR